MPGTSDTPPPTPAPCSLCKEDWLIIDVALHRVARSLRKIAKEEERKKREEADSHLPAHQQ